MFFLVSPILGRFVVLGAFAVDSVLRRRLGVSFLGSLKALGDVPGDSISTGPISKLTLSSTKKTNGSYLYQMKDRKFRQIARLVYVQPLIVF